MGNTIYYPNGNTSSSSGTPASNNTSTSYVNLLINMLETGLSLSNGDGSYCCPTCLEGQTKIYFLASIPKAIQILNGLGYQQGDSLNCCLNISSSTTTPAFQYLNSLFKYQCCPNNFSECVNELTSKLGAACCNELQQIGIVEYGTLELTEGSPFCTILTNLLKVAPALTPEEICQIYKEILDMGIIFKCDGCNITIEKGPDFGACYCYKFTVPETVGNTSSITTNCQGIPVTYSNLALGDYYYCSELEPIVSAGVTSIKQSDCALVPCTSPPPPCICYELVVTAPQLTPIPVQLSCQGVLTVESINKGTYRFCSDSYPIVSPEVQVTALNDCATGPCVSPPPPACVCYSVYNPNSNVCSFEFTECTSNFVTLTTINPSETVYVCAIVNTIAPNCPMGQLVITVLPNDCATCIAPPPPVCNCYKVDVVDPNNPGSPASCGFTYTDCSGNPVSTLITTTGYLCSQTLPVGSCRGINVTIIPIQNGDCNNPAVGCPPII